MVFYMQTCFNNLKSLILHVHFLQKFIYNEYIGPYFVSHVVLRFLRVNSPRDLETPKYRND